MSRGSRLLSDEDRKIIVEEYWSRLSNDVKLIYINSRDDRCQYCDIIRQLYEELSSESDKLRLEEYYYEDDTEYFKEKYSVKAAPVIVLEGVNEGKIKFYGIPSGMEFPSFIETIVRISRGETDLPKSIEKEIRGIDKYANIQIFVTPSCPYCPKMVSTSYMFAMLNKNINSEAWESIEFPEISMKYDVTAVPKIVINNSVSWEGLVPPEYLLHNLYIELYPEKVKEKTFYKGPVERI